MTNVIYDHNVFIVPDFLHIMMIIIMPYTSHTVILTKNCPRTYANFKELCTGENKV